MAAIQRYFVPPCARLVSSNGWLNETRIDVEVDPYKDVDDKGVAGPTPSCVATPTRFSFDVVSGDFALQIIEVNIPWSVPLVTSEVPNYIPENPKR
jgi:hypothetical protein